MFHVCFRLTKDSNCHFIDFLVYFNSCHQFKADYFSLYEFGWGTNHSFYNIPQILVSAKIKVWLFNEFDFGAAGLRGGWKGRVREE